VKTCVGLKSAYKASGCTFVFQPLDGRLPDSHCLMHACRQQQFVLLVTVRKMRLDQLCVLTVKHANRNGSPIFVVKQIVSMTTVVNEARSVSSKYGSTRSRPAPSPALRVLPKARTGGLTARRRLMEAEHCVMSSAAVHNLHLADDVLISALHSMHDMPKVPRTSLLPAMRA